MEKLKISTSVSSNLMVFRIMGGYVFPFKGSWKEENSWTIFISRLDKITY